MFIEQVMTTPAVTVGPEVSASHALELLQQGGFRHLPVVRVGRLIGMVSDRDLRVARALTEEPTVGTIACEDVITIGPEAPVEEAAALMLEHRIGALPVLRHGQMIGIVTESDIFRTMARMMGVLEPSTRVQLELTDLTRQLADIVRIAADLGASIVSLVTEPGTTTGHQIVVLRVSTIAPAHVIRAIERAGVRVMGPEGVTS